MPTAPFVSSSGVAPSIFEVNAYEREDNRERALTRRMRELDKPRLANCDQSGADGGRFTEDDLDASDFPFQDQLRFQSLKMQPLFEPGR